LATLPTESVRGKHSVVLPTLRTGNAKRARFHAAATDCAAARIQNGEQRVVTETGGVSQEHDIFKVSSFKFQVSSSGFQFCVLKVHLPDFKLETWNLKLETAS
jgi:hypothetical protein